eukprot:CAMPEP_0168286206 /NCGR_PEP_ID=MMETSP0142_2-20121227/883_1 /TAXON_ID=44445 /ORGANISM="Pseudo-nitzschia australis, Strain 10249 10 AB" /LENGTH=131 /DNA_ID=CAMNT_0008230727 /DNA_START=82 /DNA_END=474 /DNA_ORIENTATION=+
MVVNFIPKMTTTRWNGTEDRCELRCVAAGPCRGPRSARARHPSQTRFASSPMQRSSSMRQSFAISFPPLPDDGPVPGMFGLIRKYCWLLLGSQLSIGLYFAIAIAIVDSPSGCSCRGVLAALRGKDVLAML